MSLLESTFITFPINPECIGYDYPPSREKLHNMLQMEEFIRMSSEYSDECSKVKDEVNGWLRISGEVQEKVAHKYGYMDTISNLLAVNYMRRASYLFPNDTRFTQTQVYIRNNLVKDGSLQLGDIFPKVKLANLLGEEIDSYNISKSNKKSNKYSVIIASSAT